MSNYFLHSQLVKAAWARHRMLLWWLFQWKCIPSEVAKVPVVGWRQFTPNYTQWWIHISWSMTLKPSGTTLHHDPHLKAQTRWKVTCRSRRQSFRHARASSDQPACNSAPELEETAITAAPRKALMETSSYTQIIGAGTQLSQKHSHLAKATSQFEI